MPQDFGDTLNVYGQRFI